MKDLKNQKISMRVTEKKFFEELIRVGIDSDVASEIASKCSHDDEFVVTENLYNKINELKECTENY